MPHPIFTLLAAAALSVAMAMVGDRSPRERLYAGARVFFSCMMTTLGGSWLMRLIHG
ncbi:MAG TPA: hypothetical protein VLY04_15275 [Bryobacteraceae bacterium]|nr:hypothetical protein [Bryobacteraceae bacterium]